MTLQHRAGSAALGRAARTLAMAAATLLVTTLTTPARAAQEVPSACPPDAAFSYGNVSYSHIQGPPYSQGPAGHHLSIQITAGMTMTATATITGSGSVSAIVAGARVDVSASLAVSLTASVTYGDTWTVPNGVKQGYLAAGAASRRMNWTHGQYNGACQWIVDGHGTLNAPYHLPAFWSWTT
jgi:hypothetical protein